MNVDIMLIDPGLPVPRYAHEGDAGLDLHSAESITLAPGERALVSTGIAIAVPAGYAAFVQPRSGLALRYGLTLVNTPGLIDSHYRGEIKVIVLNTDRQIPIEIARGDKIAQLVVQRVEHVSLMVVEALDETVRGENGFGSSGV